MFVHNADKLAEMRTKFHIIQAKLIMSVWCFTVQCCPLNVFSEYCIVQYCQTSPTSLTKTIITVTHPNLMQMRNSVMMMRMRTQVCRPSLEQSGSSSSWNVSRKPVTPTWTYGQLFFLPRLICLVWDGKVKVKN